MIRLLLADDNDFVRQSLVDLLTARGDMSVVAECSDGDEVVEAAQRTRPDVVIVDLAMARVGGLEAARRLLAVQPDARVVILTATLSAAAVREARELGVVALRQRVVAARHLAFGIVSQERARHGAPPLVGPAGPVLSRPCIT